MQGPHKEEHFKLDEISSDNYGVRFTITNVSSMPLRQFLIP
jgi:hypothetical protein